MLILSRKKGERVMIGENIVITVLEIRSKEVVALGVEAPGLEVHREEVRQRIREEKRQEMKDDSREPRERAVSSQTGFDE